MDKNKYKDKKVVALKYDKSEMAPEVVAKGSGYLAEKLLEKGKAADIAVYEDKQLVEELTKLEIGENIPPELYEVVAKILLFIGDLDKLQGKNK